MNLIRLISWLFWEINLLICSTLRYKVHNEPSGQFLFALWHGQTFPLFYWARHRKLCLFPSDIWRGEVIAFLAKKYGYKTIRFPEKGTPLQISRILEILSQTIREGFEAAITVDGPPKPLIYRKAKPGILFFSQTTGVPIVPVGINMKKKKTLFWRWDKYEIPLPWSEVEIFFGKPFMATENTTTAELEELLSRPGGEQQSAADRSAVPNN